MKKSVKTTKTGKADLENTPKVKRILRVGRPVKGKTGMKLSQVGKEKQTRIEILQTIASITDLSKTQVEAVFATVTELLQNHMKKKGSGEFTIPMTGIKIRRIKKKATKARNMVSPLTKQEVVIPAKPARSAIKLTALKSLKTAVTE